MLLTFSPLRPGDPTFPGSPCGAEKKKPTIHHFNEGAYRCSRMQANTLTLTKNQRIDVQKKGSFLLPRVLYHVFPFCFHLGCVQMLFIQHNSHVHSY